MTSSMALEHDRPRPLRCDRFADLLLAPLPRGLLPSSALFLLRAGFGLSMALTHGLGTLAGFLGNPGDYPDPLGLGPELSMGLMVFAELVCALAVAVGFLTRLAVVPLVVGMSTAVFVVHAGDPFGHRESAYLYLVAWLVLLFAGPGRFSLDCLLFRGRRRGSAAQT